MTYAEAAEKYMSWAKVKYKTSGALGNNIPSNARMFGLFMRNPEIEKVTLEDVTSYISLMLALGWHNNTIRRKMAHLRNFFHFLQLQRLQVIDYRTIPCPEKQFSEPTVVTEEQYRKIISVIPTHDIHGPRDLAMISLLHDTGMRLGELQ
jgi:site-specific recombinase XerD